MKDVATTHGFLLETYGACAGDMYRHSQKREVRLRITECKNTFKLYVNGNNISGSKAHFEQTLINHGF